MLLKIRKFTDRQCMLGILNICLMIFIHISYAVFLCVCLLHWEMLTYILTVVVVVNCFNHVIGSQWKHRTFCISIRLWFNGEPCLSQQESDKLYDGGWNIHFMSWIHKIHTGIGCQCVHCARRHNMSLISYWYLVFCHKMNILTCSNKQTLWQKVLTKCDYADNLAHGMLNTVVSHWCLYWISCPPW